jgi:hypothetical protein
MPLKMAKLACALAPKLEKKFSSFDGKGELGSMVTTPILICLVNQVFAGKNAKMWVILP